MQNQMAYGCEVVLCAATVTVGSKPPLVPGGDGTVPQDYYCIP